MGFTERMVKALEEFAEGVNPDPAMTRLLHDDGYITVAETTNMQSLEREFLAISITEKGRELLERWKKQAQRGESLREVAEKAPEKQTDVPSGQLTVSKSLD